MTKSQILDYIDSSLLLFRIPLGGVLPPLKFALNGWWIQAVRNGSASLNSTLSQHRLNSEPTPTQLWVNTDSNNDQALNDQALNDQSTINHSIHHNDQALNDQSTINQRSPIKSTIDQSINDQSTITPLKSTIDQSTIDQSINDQSRMRGTSCHWCNDKCEVITDWIKPQCLTIRSAGIFGGADD